tara:strand:+ start:544 stop:1521 length:978 start_codon:yes stop_codon:yes gene_type:complete
MAFKLKGMTFGKGTGYKSPQMMKKESAMKMAKKSSMKKKSEDVTRAQMDRIKNLSEGEMKMAMRKTVKELTPKSRATNRKPQSQMTDAELAEVKGIKKPQSIKPTPPRRKYGDTPNKMAKKSAMKKNGKTTKKFTGDKAMLNALLKSGALSRFGMPDTYKKGQALSKTRDGKKVYDSDEIKKNPGESLSDYYDRVDKTNRKEYAKSFIEMANKKKNKSPKTMKKGSAMDMKKNSAMDMKKGSAMKKKQKTRTFKNPFTGTTRTTTKGKGGKTVEVVDKEGNLKMKKVKGKGIFKGYKSKARAGKGTYMDPIAESTKERIRTGKEL